MILTLIILTANLGNTPVYGASKPDSPDILSESAIVLEAGTGKVLYEKNADRDMYPGKSDQNRHSDLCLGKRKPRGSGDSK